MKKIAILVPRGDVLPAAVVGSYSLFTQVNQYLLEAGRNAIFQTEVLGYADMIPLYDGIVAIHPHRSFQQTDIIYDLLIIPGFTCEMDVPLRENSDLIDWMKKQYLKHGTELASMCTGAFLMAATGLLDGKNCTTHWAFEPSFRSRFPAVKLQPDKIVTDDNGLYSSGGAYSSLNLILYLLEKFAGKDSAVWASKVFQIDLDRQSQKRFIIFQQQKGHADDSVSAVQEYIEQHFTENMNIQALATRFTFSRRNLIRRFKEATGNTPIEYIQRVRIEAAKRMLESSPKSIGEIILSTGYSDTKTFRDVFRKYTGYAPSHYRSRYQR